MPKDQDYLGDGVYVENQGDMIKTWTPRESGIHLIYYGPKEMWSLLYFLRRVGWLTDEALEQLRGQPTPEERKKDDLGGLEDSTDG